MDILNFLNSDLVFPVLALLVVVIYFVNRVRTRRKFKR
jgi:Na+-transporting methylmalonyl-CoA/oxaloacetate decarboxylase gamma subunit